MHIIKFVRSAGSVPEIGLASGESIIPLVSGAQALTELLAANDVPAVVEQMLKKAAAPIAASGVRILPPLDQHEVWGAGVTYERSKVAREQESDSAAIFYDRVYQADRPELFFKATPSRVVGAGGAVRVRRDSKWTVPEPELALVLTPGLKCVGYTIGNDMSARDIEGRNPLYLPQAKVYSGCCALGPGITLAADFPARGEVGIRMAIRRGGATVFNGSTSLSRMARPLEELIDWLGRENAFPDGVILLTGTGLVPPDDFALQAGDEVGIAIDGIGELVNPVEG